MSKGYQKHVYHPKDFKFKGVTGLKGAKLTDGHWLKYIVPAEDQNKGFETNACTTFGTMNALEILMKFKGIDIDFSKRFSAITSGTDPASGNDPVKVAQTAHSTGLIPESELPFDGTITSNDLFYSPKPMTQNYLNDAQKFLQQYGIGYDSVANDEKSLKEALCYSPLGIGVKAWYPTSDPIGTIYTFPDNMPYDHWVALIDYEDQKWWVCYDSYAENIKRIEWGALFEDPIRYQIGSPEEVQLTLMDWLAQKLNILIHLYQQLLSQLKGRPNKQ